MSTSNTWNSFPGEFIRDRYTVTNQKKVKQESMSKTTPLTISDYEFLRCQELAFHTDVTTISTCGNPAYNTWITTIGFVDMVLLAPDPVTGGSLPVTYPGHWMITSVDCCDNGNGTSRVSVTLQLETDWHAYTPIS